MTDLEARRSIAETLLDGALDADGFAPCPGRTKHTSRDGPRDFRVWLDGAPSGRCVHDSCAAEVEAFNHELRSRIGAAERGDGPARLSSPLGKVAPLPAAPREAKRPAYDADALRRIASLCGRSVSIDWLAERSPVIVPPVDEQGAETAELFLSSLYRAGERVLVFTSQLSQGDFLFHAGTGCARLARERGVDPVPSPLPTGGRQGVWFLTNPVCGEWRINAQSRDAEGSP